MKEYSEDCFAFVQPGICAALNECKCKNCSFYKHKNDVYDITTVRLIQKEKQRIKRLQQENKRK